MADWWRGLLVRSTSWRLENGRAEPVDMSFDGMELVIEYRDFDSRQDASTHRYRLFRLAGQRDADGHWRLSGRDSWDHSIDLVLVSCENGYRFEGRLDTVAGSEFWRIDLEVPLTPPSVTDDPSDVRPAWRRLQRAPTCYHFIAAQRLKGESHQRDALLFAGRLSHRARLPLREVDVLAESVLLGLATSLPGHAGSRSAARIVLDELQRTMLQRPELCADGRPGHVLMVELRRQLHRRLGCRRHGRGAGSSVVLAHLRGDDLVLLALGTCRALTVNADGTAKTLNREQSVWARRRDSGDPLPERGCPPAYRHPHEYLDCDPDSGLMPLQRLRLRLDAKASLLLLSPGAAATLAGEPAPGDALLAESVQKLLGGVRPLRRQARRLDQALAAQPAGECAGFVLLRCGDLALPVSP